jgi:hypothetical protein
MVVIECVLSTVLTTSTTMMVVVIENRARNEEIVSCEMNDNDQGSKFQHEL